MAEVWSSRDVVITGASGRGIRLEAKVAEPRRPRDGWLWLVGMGGMVAIGIFVPPLLLLNIPLLLARAAVVVVRRSRQERVSLGAFACPECGRQNPPGERRGELPLDIACARCAAPLSVGQVPRTWTAG